MLDLERDVIQRETQRSRDFQEKKTKFHATFTISTTSSQQQPQGSRGQKRFNDEHRTLATGDDHFIRAIVSCPKEGTCHVKKKRRIADHQGTIVAGMAPEAAPDDPDPVTRSVDTTRHGGTCQLIFDDECDGCGMLMYRNMQLSYLVCPNPSCQRMRWFIDTVNYSTISTIARVDVTKNAPKCFTHYSTFLNTCQGKSSKRFTPEFLQKLCYYCYVEGGRHATDITKKLVNRAQRHLGVTEYNITAILICILRGHQLCMPREVVKKLQVLFKAMLPVFTLLKPDLSLDRTNMINFNFISRTNCRLLGYDVFTRLFPKFSMPANERRHSVFIRRMYLTLGWEWRDREFVDLSDEELDTFERQM